MYITPRWRWLFATAMSLFAVPVLAAAPIAPETAVSDIMRLFETSQVSDTILEAAKSLFWSLALISLVWTMGMLVIRQDIGELLMELLRFIVITGLFYWVLINASSRQGGEGFVEDIVMSFLQMVNDETSDASFRTNANNILQRCLYVFFAVINETGDGQDADRVIVGGMVVLILCIGAVMTAQFLIALVMAWILGYAGIFLLGFGGARWTSQIAINYYKHVVAVGVAMLALSLIGAITVGLVDELGLTANGRMYSEFNYLGLMLAVMILMQVLAIKVPQLLYTLVTGSTLGLYAGSASAAGTAIAIAGSSAYSTAFSRSPGGGGAGGLVSPGGTSGGSPSHRTESVMDAVQRSAAAGSGMADPFHVHSGADPFGVQRAPDSLRGGRGGSVFGGANVGSAPAAPVVDFPGDATTAPGVPVPEGRGSSGIDRSGQWGANDERAARTDGASPLAADIARTDVVSSGGAGVDAAFDARSTSGTTMDAVPRETQDLSGDGQQISMQHIASGDLRAHTLSTVDTTADAHVDVKVDTRSAMSGNAPGHGSDGTRSAGMTNEPLRHVDPIEPAHAHADGRDAGSRRTAANANEIQRATSHRLEDAVHETGANGESHITPDGDAKPHTRGAVFRNAPGPGPNVMQSSDMAADSLVHARATEPVPGQIYGKTSERMGATATGVQGATSHRLEDAPHKTETAESSEPKSHLPREVSQADPMVDTGIERTTVDAASELHVIENRRNHVDPTGSGDLALGGVADEKLSPSEPTNPHRPEISASEPSQATAADVETPTHTEVSPGAHPGIETKIGPQPASDQAPNSLVTSTKRSTYTAKTSLVQEDMQPASPAGTTLDVVPGAAVEASPDTSVPGAPDSTVSSDELSPRLRKRRVRRWQDEGQQAMPPSSDDDGQPAEDPS